MTADQWTFRRLTRRDFPMLAQWLATPPMARWWDHEWSPEAVERDFGQAADGLEPSEDFVALRDGRAVGIIQRCLIHDYPEYVEELAPLVELPTGVATIDYGIGDPDLLGRGLGTAMLAAFVALTWTDLPDSPALVVAVNATNAASWRALEKVGFRIVASGAMTPDNPVDEPLHHVLRMDRPPPPQTVGPAE